MGSYKSKRGAMATAKLDALSDLIVAARRIVRARDYLAAGDPVGGLGADEAFDDWAADLLEPILKRLNR